MEALLVLNNEWYNNNWNKPLQNFFKDLKWNMIYIDFSYKNILFTLYARRKYSNREKFRQIYMV